MSHASVDERRLWVVVLAGGTGSRFWPLSTPARPKQLLALVDEDPLLVDTVRRLEPLAPLARMLILTNEALRAPIAALLPGMPPENLIAEPRPAGTAAALAWAAKVVSERDGRDAVMLCVHADWSIGDEDAFRATLLRAALVADAHRSLVTVGVLPTRDDPGFGYIEPGVEIEPGVRGVARFVEKPDRERAAQMRRDGYLWNSGIFVWRAGDFLEQIESHCPEVAPALLAAGDDIERFFRDVIPVPVDIGVMERSERVLVLPGDFAWDDVGTWGALGRVRSRDADGNAVSGRTHLREARGNVVHADGNTVVLYGVDDLVVVTTNGLTLVTTVERSSDLKALVESMSDELRARA